MCGVLFPVVDASGWELAGLEQRGATEHLWLRNPEDGELYLWKPSTGRRAERREHWAEKIGSEVARLVGVPCAQVELAEREGIVGCLSRNLQGHGYQLYPGALLLAELDPGFRPDIRGHEAYTVENTAHVLRDVQAPRNAGPQALPAEMGGFDVFAGYLVFDALVLNRDRHAANWSVLRRRDGSEPDRLCPLYDNASSLALSLGDASRRKRLDSRGVAAYAARESAARPFARPDGVVRTLYEVSAAALNLCSPHARSHWLTRVGDLSAADVGLILDAVPGMSELVRTFTTELIDCTRRRLADVCAA